MPLSTALVPRHRVSAERDDELVARDERQRRAHAFLEPATRRDGTRRRSPVVLVVGHENETVRGACGGEEGRRPGSPNVTSIVRMRPRRWSIVRSSAASITRGEASSGARASKSRLIPSAPSASTADATSATRRVRASGLASSVLVSALVQRSRRGSRAEAARARRAPPAVRRRARKGRLFPRNRSSTLRLRGRARP